MDKFRLITRSDFDGLVCAVLLKHLDMVESIKFVHPKDMQDGKIPVTDRDITTNMPYVPGVHLCFDHHMSEMLRNEARPENFVINPEAPSAARVVYEHFGGAEVFPAAWNEMMAAVDKSDSAQFSREEIIKPSGWVLLSFLMDARTGLGRFCEFRISNYTLMMDLIGYCSTMQVDEILQLPDVVERINLYHAHEKRFAEQLKRCAKVYQNLLVLDLREEETIWAGNRFMVYALFPDTNISIHVMWGKEMANVIYATGKSIINRSSKTDVGKLMLKYGGGGHRAAGTCQVKFADAEQVLKELIEEITQDG